MSRFVVKVLDSLLFHRRKLLQRFILITEDLITVDVTVPICEVVVRNDFL